MPDVRGNLSAEDLAYIQGKLDSYFNRPLLCPVSLDRNWLIQPVIVVPPRYASGVSPGNEIVYPAVPVSCATCGYTMFFNAVQIGLYSPAPGQPPATSL